MLASVVSFIKGTKDSAVGTRDAKKRGRYMSRAVFEWKPVLEKDLEDDAEKGGWMSWKKTVA